MTFGHSPGRGGPRPGDSAAKARDKRGQSQTLPDEPMPQPLVTLLNGPNLNLLGQRQPELYGHDTLADVEAMAARVAGELGLGVRCQQSNWEGQIVDWIQEARADSAGIVINPAALSHTSVAILDALNTFEGPVMEVHISNIHKREGFRQHSYISQRADAVIAGAGIQGYELALRRLASLIG